MIRECSTCRYRERDSLAEPCNTGIYQRKYSGRCFEWRRRTIIQWFLEKVFGDGVKTFKI